MYNFALKKINKNVRASLRLQELLTIHISGKWLGPRIHKEL